MKLETAGRRPTLNLPGAGSWMSPGQSAFSSLALLVVIVALLVAKALAILRCSRHRPRRPAVQNMFFFHRLGRRVSEPCAPRGETRGTVPTLERLIGQSGCRCLIIVVSCTFPGMPTGPHTRERSKSECVHA